MVIFATSSDYYENHRARFKIPAKFRSKFRFQAKSGIFGHRVAGITFIKSGVFGKFLIKETEMRH
jgi:hypothetical protein